MNNTMSPILSFVGNSAGSASMNRPGASSTDSGSWYEAMSKAWGQTLDAQASQITSLSDVIGYGGDQPSNMVKLTAESLKMQFLSNNAATSQNRVGQALETLGKRQSCMPRAACERGGLAPPRGADTARAALARSRRRRQR